MSDSPSERRLVENELILRAQNINGKEAIKKYFAPQKDLQDLPLEFHCECSDLTCGETIKLTIATYEKLHDRDDRFCVCKGHEDRAVEKVISEKSDYNVVEKEAVPA